MKFEAEHYRQAASERIQAARLLFEQERYPECVYLAGVAVECILRAYRMRSDPQFDAKHDLEQLLGASGLEEFIPRKRRANVAAALGEVWARWKNNYRYTSAEQLGRTYRQLKLFNGVRGNQLKANARTILDNGLELVGIGEARWHC